MVDQKKRPEPGETVKDFDLIVPPSRWGKIGGELFDAARIPTGTTLELIRLHDEALAAAEKGDSAASFAIVEATIKEINSVLEPTNAKLTVAFLREHTTIVQIGALCRFIVEGVVKGNAAAAKPTS